ncbi:MAG: MBL fold metallo-hydrolase [Hyphomicrobiales bacterium]|nr:MBL fold metallo-hydrolase [Hyphomicrobiales bacterium]
MTLHVTILGCGASPGVPQIDGKWGVCDPANPKNRRSRCALLVERHDHDKRTTLLVDTGPDIRQQLLAAGVAKLDGVFYTHDHADHTHGIDDLRMISYRRRKLIDVYCTDYTRSVLEKRFDYCFASQDGNGYPPILQGHSIQPGEAIRIEGEGGPIMVIPFLQYHGGIESLGFRFGNVAYSSDLHDMPEASLPLLKGLDCWIVDALRPSKHSSHFSFHEALEWIERVGPKRAVLTHMNIDMDYETVQRQTPDHIEPAYDGMRFEVTE